MLTTQQPSTVDVTNRNVQMQVGGLEVRSAEWTFRLIAGYSHGKPWALGLLGELFGSLSVRDLDPQAPPGPEVAHHLPQVVAVTVELLRTSIQQLHFYWRANPL